MLVEFAVANFRSIRERQALSMVSGPSRLVRSRHSHHTSHSSAPYVLRAAAIYGGNASGKTSLVMAMDYARDFIRGDITSDPDDQTNVTPYKFSAKTRVDPSEFEFIFLHEGILYQYGFSVNSERIISEWLYSTPKGRATVRLIARDYDPTNGRYHTEISSTVPGKRKTWIESTRDNALILTTAVSLNAAALKTPYHWLTQKLRILLSPSRLSPKATATYIQEESYKERISQFLSDIGLEIVDVTSVEEHKFTEKQLALFPVDAQSRLKERKETKVLCGHLTEEGDTAYLPFEDESDGTRALFALAVPFLDVTDHGLTLIVDELHNHLHPFATRYLLDSFFTSDAPPPGGQLIFSTHETFTMSEDVLHRDQVWLIDRMGFRGSLLKPLSDFSVRSGEAYRTSYLRGRFGGIPHIASSSVSGRSLASDTDAVDARGEG